MTTTALTEIIAFIFGRKYYANILGTHGTTKTELSSFIFSSLKDAQEHRKIIEDDTQSFYFITTVSFRSREALNCAR